jgi:hypothetical protein
LRKSKSEKGRILHLWKVIKILRLNPTPHVIPTSPPRQHKPARSANFNHTINRDANARRITRCIAQQIHVSTTELLHCRQPRHAAVVLELLRPVRLLLYAVCHCRLDEAQGHVACADVVSRPFHGERVRHNAETGFGGAVRGRGDALREFSIRNVGKRSEDTVGAKCTERLVFIAKVGHTCWIMHLFF